MFVGAASKRCPRPSISTTSGAKGGGWGEGLGVGVGVGVIEGKRLDENEGDMDIDVVTNCDVTGLEVIGNEDDKASIVLLGKKIGGDVSAG